MASGLPIVVTSNCCAAEIIRPGQEGLILDTVDDIVQLCGHLDALHVPERRKLMSAGAHSRAEDFPIEQTLAAFEDLYHRLLTSRKTVPRNRD